MPPDAACCSDHDCRIIEWSAGAATDQLADKGVLAYITGMSGSCVHSDKSLLTGQKYYSLHWQAVREALEKY
jgi:hypothetical protein